MKAYTPLLTIGLVFLVLGCNRKEEPQPFHQTVNDCSFHAEDVFHQSRYITDALGLDPGPDGMLTFTFGTDLSFVSFQYPSKGLDTPTPNLSATTEPVPASTERIAFHLEFPVTVGQTLPYEIEDVESVALNGPVQFTLTLDPNFPYTKAVVEQATITLPDWVEEWYPMNVFDHRMEWPYLPETIRPGQVNSFDIYCSTNHVLQEGESYRKQRLDLDGTVSVDGVLSVDKKDLKMPQHASPQWSATFLFHWSSENCMVSSVTGRIDLAMELADRTVTFSEIPAFLKDGETVFDLEDLYGEMVIQNHSSIPVSVNGTILGDERKYPFGQSVGADETIHALLSEKGGREGGYADFLYSDMPIRGFSGLIDRDPVSFALKDMLVTSDPDITSTFVFDENNYVSIQAEISSPLLIGKDFRAKQSLDVLLLKPVQDVITRITGSFSVENTLPFDYEIRPVFRDNFHQDVPVEARPETMRLAAGSLDYPRTERFSFDWTVNADFRHVVFEFIGHTAENRQGETLHKDQHLAVKDLVFEIY